MKYYAFFAISQIVSVQKNEVILESEDFGAEWSGMGGEEAGLGEGGRFAYVYPVGGGRDLGTADG